MTDPPEMVALDKATQAYRKTEAAHEKARDAAITAVVAALKAEIPPTEVANRSPFTPAYVRVIARDNDIPPAKPGIKPKGTTTRRRTE